MDTFTREELERVVSRSSLPGIDPTELRVVQEFLRRHGAEFREYRFNVRVGEGVTLAGDYGEKFIEDWRRRTQMRLDLVCWNPPNLATLVEAKVQWMNDAVWQLLNYRDHYQTDHPGEQLSLAGICEAYTPNARTLAGDQGIRLYVYRFPAELPAAAATSAEEA